MCSIDPEESFFQQVQHFLLKQRFASVLQDDNKKLILVDLYQ